LRIAGVVIVVVVAAVGIVGRREPGLHDSLQDSCHQRGRVRRSIRLLRTIGSHARSKHAHRRPTAHHGRRTMRTHGPHHWRTTHRRHTVAMSEGKTGHRVLVILVERRRHRIVGVVAASCLHHSVEKLSHRGRARRSCIRTVGSHARAKHSHHRRPSMRTHHGRPTVRPHGRPTV